MPEASLRTAVKSVAFEATAFACAGSIAWLTLQASELDRGDFASYPGALAYLTRLSLAYSALGSLGMLLVHALRARIQRVSAHAESYTLCLLLVLLVAPSFHQAFLLTSGGQIADSALARPLRLTFFAGLLCGNLGLWLVHLLLCRPPGFAPPAWPAWLTRLPASLRFALLWLAGASALVVCVHELDHGLRQYTFLARFVLPSLWLLAASLAYGLHLRAPQRVRVLLLMAAGVALLALTPASARAVKRARAMVIRNGAVAALTDFVVSPNQSVAFANLDVSSTTKLVCSESEMAPEIPAPAPKNHRNVILISIDALRRDALDADVGGRLAMPSLRDFSARSLRFDRAVTSYPATLFALGSALTGQSASELMFAPSPPQNVLGLTRERFDKQVISLPDTGWFKKPIVEELFTQDVRTHFAESASDQTRFMIAQLEASRRAKQRVFAWIHYYEPHEAVAHAVHLGKPPRTGYLRSVNYVDGEMGRLFDSLRKLGYLDDSLVIVFADHGESLGERGYYGHHVYLNRWLIDIPLLVHAPDLLPGYSQALTSIADITPTILAWTGTPAPPMDARSLLDPKLRGRAHEAGERYAVAEAFPIRGNELFSLAHRPIRDQEALAERLALVQQSAEDYLPKVSITSQRYRMIVNRVTGAEELYDRVHDPSEEHDLADENPSLLSRMRNVLARWHRHESNRIRCRVQNQLSSPDIPPEEPADRED